MFSSTEEALGSQFCLVYDKETGKVVHIHEFVAADPSGAASSEMLETQALQLAPTKFERHRLAVFHPEKGQTFSRHFRYRIDTHKQALIVDKADQVPASALDTRRRV